MNQESANERRRLLLAARRIVIKIGTSTVTGDGGKSHRERVPAIAEAIAALRAERKQVVMVSSGAVGLGAGRLGLARARLKDVVTKQACAAIGQSLLMNAYENLFRPHNINIAQILLTESDFTDWHRYMNLRRTMETLLKLGVLPIINENDTVSTAELERVSAATDGNTAQPVFGDNDRLAALVMSKLDADVLVMLTDVDGLYARRPNAISAETPNDKANNIISLVEEITPHLKSVAAGASAGGRGGMVTVEAANIAMQAGGIAVIASGRRADTLGRIFAGEPVGTTFMARARMAGKRRWIAYAAHARGRIVVNSGAREAIMSNKASLLISGVLRVEEDFDEMDVVSIHDAEGREFARGIVNCASAQAEALITEQHSTQMKAGAKAFVLVTRNNIVLRDSLNA